MMSLLAEAIARIKELLDEAKASDLREPTAMSVATVDELGRPAVRTVLLKHLDESGLVFFTNRKSRKGMHLQAVPYAAVCIYFQQAHQQVQVDGKIVMVSDEEADGYWQTRPRASQIGAWASRQSEVLDTRQQLYDRVWPSRPLEPAGAIFAWQRGVEQDPALPLRREYYFLIMFPGSCVPDEDRSVKCRLLSG
jgi:pyridoxamine 5'-phosphate oxidase